MSFLRTFAVAVISLLPLYIVRFTLFGLPTTLLEFALITFFLVWFVDIAGKNQMGVVYSQVPHKKLLALFVGIGLVSALISPDLRGGLGLFRAYFLEPVVFFVVCVNLARRRILFVTDVLLGFAISAFYLSFLAIVQYVFQADWFAPHEIAAGRVSGVFNSANALALYLEPVIFALGVVVLRDFKVSKRGLFFAGTLVVSVIAIALSRSLGGFVAFMCLIGVLVVRYFIFQLKLSKKLLYIHSTTFGWLVISLFAVTLMLVMLSYKQVGKMQPVAYTGPNTFLIRMIVWTGTFNLLHDHGVAGAGLGGFKELYSLRYLPVQYTEPLQYPHNIFLNFWSETGLAGILVFCVLCFLFLQDADKKRNEVRIIVYGVLFLIFLHGLVDVPYFKNDLSMEFWLFMALIYFQGRKQGERALY